MMEMRGSPLQPLFNSTSAINNLNFRPERLPFRLQKIDRIAARRLHLPWGRFFIGESEMEYVPMTRESYDRLKEEVTRMENEEMPKIAEKIAEARAEGDLKENAEYHAQREAQGYLQAKINERKSRLARAKIVDPATVNREEVAFGAKVTVKDLADDMEEEFMFVGSGDEDYLNGKYLITSPVGQGLLGKKVGDVAEIEAPKGMLRYEVLGIEYPDLDG